MSLSTDSMPNLRPLYGTDWEKREKGVTAALVVQTIRHDPGNAFKAFAVEVVQNIPEQADVQT